MSAPRPRHAALRIVAGSLVALVAVLAACESRLPTEADVDNMTATSAQKAAAKVGLTFASDSLTTYYIDGYIAGAAAARSLSPAQIATVRVQRDSANPGRSSMWITRVPAGTAAARDVHFKVDVGSHATFAGLYVVDGKRMDQSAFTALRLNPSDIASIDVTKGTSAVERYPNDPAAARGVIQITTKQHAH